jgi:hypothetical protein
MKFWQIGASGHFFADVIELNQKPRFRYHQTMQEATNQFAQPTPFRTYDPRLEPIAAKVLAGERLDFNDGLVLYGSHDVLAVGWLANHVRERMHGDVTYFNVNRHINPTNVCVAACRLCAFGRKKGDPAGYTMAPAFTPIFRWNTFLTW